VLNANGGEIKAKANGSATTCEISKRVELELFDLFKILLLSKFGLLWGECMIMGKRGSFWLLFNFSIGISLFVPKQVCLT
jgi:hypothetical protein